MSRPWPLFTGPYRKPERVDLLSERLKWLQIVLCFAGALLLVAWVMS